MNFKMINYQHVTIFYQISNLYITVHNFLFPQALPFVATIPGGVKADVAVLFYGTILADSNE